MGAGLNAGKPQVWGKYGDDGGDGNECAELFHHCLNSQKRERTCQCDLS